MVKVTTSHSRLRDSRVRESEKALPQWYGHHRVLGIPTPETLVIWASPVTQILSLTQIAKVIWEGDDHISMFLGMAMPISL